MRELKFRVYDEEAKKIYQVETWDELQMPNVMQFTGLLDKSGKKIYEGDIVTGNQQVYFEKGCFWVNERTPLGYLDINLSLEVTGNIWESPELLSTKE